MATARLFRPSGTERNLQGVAWAALLTAGLALGATAPAQGQQLLARHSDPLKATSSREAREEAIRSIPLDKISGDAQATVKAVLSNVSIYRRMPVRMIQCDPEMYLFLVHHPDVIVNVWQVLGITQIALTQLETDCYRLTDSAGTEGTVRLLYQSPDTHLVYTEGKYEGPFSTRPTQGRVVLLMKTGYVRQPDGQCLITVRLDTFMQVEPGGVELLTKAFQPIMGKIADINFMQTIEFVGSLSRTAEVNCRGVQRLASKLSSVEPDVRDQFADVAQRIAEKAAATAGASPEEPLVARSAEETSTK